MKPKEVIEFAKKNDVKFVDLKFIDFPGSGSTRPSRRIASTRRSSRRASASTARRSAAGSRSTRRDMIMIPDADDGEDRSVLRQPTLSMICSVSDPITSQPYSRDPRYIAQEGRGVPTPDRHRRHRRSSGPRPSSSSSISVRYDSSGREAPSTRSTREEGDWNSRQGGHEPRLQDAPQGRLLPGPADRHARRPPRRR